MEEAWAHVTGCFDNCRNPGSITTGGNVLGLPKMRAKMANNAPQFVWGLNDKSGVEIRAMLADQPPDLRFQFIDFLGSQSDSFRAIPRPRLGAVECGRSQVCSEKRNRCKSDRFRTFDDRTKRKPVQPLDSAACANGQGRSKLA